MAVNKIQTPSMNVISNAAIDNTTYKGKACVYSVGPAGIAMMPFQITAKTDIANYYQVFYEIVPSSYRPTTNTRVIAYDNGGTSHQFQLTTGGSLQSLGAISNETTITGTAVWIY